MLLLPKILFEASAGITASGKLRNPITLFGNVSESVQSSGPHRPAQLGWYVAWMDKANLAGQSL